jgi:hypothetical protein
MEQEGHRKPQHLQAFAVALCLSLKPCLIVSNADGEIEREY